MVTPTDIYDATKRAEELGGATYDFRTYHEKRAAEIEKRRALSLQSDQENWALYSPGREVAAKNNSDIFYAPLDSNAYHLVKNI